MARATTKDTILKNANEQFAKMWDLIDSLSVDDQKTDFNFDEAFLLKQKEAHWRRDRNVRDVLIHLYEWHQLLLNWINANCLGKAQPFLPEPYNWKTYSHMNIEFLKKHKHTSYNNARTMLLKSHEEATQLIDTFSNDELFTKKHFVWTGTTSLGSYCVSATASHYEWAIKKIKQYIKLLGVTE